MVILASASPRRRELLTLAGIEFEVCVSQVEEKIDETLSPDELVMSLAFQKAQDVAKKHPDKTVVGADTIVVLDGEVLGKPADEKNAEEMLCRLSGKTHTVYTGAALIHGEKSSCFCESTQVEFYPLSRQEILEYIASGEPMDKAGAYGIQGKGCVLVKGINGDYFTVMGLPVARLCRELKSFSE